MMADANFSLLTQKEWEVAKVGRCRSTLDDPGLKYSALGFSA